MGPTAHCQTGDSDRSIIEKCSFSFRLFVQDEAPYQTRIICIVALVVGGAKHAKMVQYC